MRLKWPFRSRAEPKNETVLDVSAITDDLLRSILSGEQITKQQALSIPAVAAAVEKITNTFSVIPFKLYKEETDSDGKKVVTLVDDPVKMDTRIYSEHPQRVKIRVNFSGG